MARRKKERKEEEASEAWLLPYSDMLTLLLGLFIVVSAMSNVDSNKFNALKNEFSQVMSLNPIKSNSAVDNVIDMGETATKGKGASSVSTKQQAAASEQRVQNSLSKQQARVQERQQLKEVAEKLKQDIQNTGRAGNTTVSYESDGVHLNLDSSILFNSGSADLSDAVKQMLDKLVPDLKQVSRNPVIVAGYTDNVPVSKRSKYASNWELSSARAVTVMRYFVSKGAISESNVSVQAYAENKPKASNDTDEGKAQNRRVEIIIQKINS
ncbi:flagellar motor protein MotB [Ligilactobacillus ruminis]|uniref:OmpA family protein n=1 Tax=Ligilactobacillus ruminis TaxID=1623 RepID=UPI001F461BA2|nr:flagellar motor protein MotB [Ligilactobacillus ruminis]MCF2544420.1 flagellar motor protein MotB [Ligilactobacillus ruminis]